MSAHKDLNLLHSSYPGYIKTTVYEMLTSTNAFIGCLHVFFYMNVMMTGDLHICIHCVYIHTAGNCVAARGFCS